MAPLVQRLGYIAFDVVDLSAATRDAEGVAGIRTVHVTPRRVMLSSNERFAEVVYCKGKRDAVRSIGLEAVDPAAVDDVVKRAQDAGLKILSQVPSLEVIARAVTFQTSEGHIFEVHTPMPRAQTRRYLCGGVHPRYLDHVNLVSSDPKRITEELVAVLGLRVSERSTGYELNWLRAGDNRHHTVGLVKGKPGLHHYSWEFADFSDFKRLGDILDAEDRCLVWGPGRHGAGDNLFTYYIDSAGFMVECTAEMELIVGEEPTRIVDVGHDLSNAKIVNRWGGLPPLAWIDHSSPFVSMV